MVDTEMVRRGEHNPSFDSDFTRSSHDPSVGFPLSFDIIFAFGGCLADGEICKLITDVTGLHTCVGAYKFQPCVYPFSFAQALSTVADHTLFHEQAPR